MYTDTPVVRVELSRNGFPLGEADFYASGENTGTDGILTADGAGLLSDLLDMGWTFGSVDNVDFKVLS